MTTTWILAYALCGVLTWFLVLWLCSKTFWRALALDSGGIPSIGVGLVTIGLWPSVLLFVVIVVSFELLYRSKTFRQLVLKAESLLITKKEK